MWQRFRGSRSADRAGTLTVTGRHQLVNNRSRKTSSCIDSDLWATTARPHLVGGGVGYGCDQFLRLGGLVWGKRATKMAIIRRARVIVSKR